MLRNYNVHYSFIKSTIGNVLNINLFTLISANRSMNKCLHTYIYIYIYILAFYVFSIDVIIAFKTLDNMKHNLMHQL